MLFRHLLLDRELQRLLDDDAVEVVEVRLVLRRADERLKLVVAHLQRRMAVEQQGLALRATHDIQLIQQSLGEEQPVEGLAAHQIAIVTVVPDLLGLIPARHRLEQRQIPMLAGRDRLV